MRTPALLVISSAATMTLGVGSAVPASAASYRVTVTCSVPKSQPERQLARNSCLNYIPDGTQTYTARVRNGSGDPVANVLVTFKDSNHRDAHFRHKQNPCITDGNGTCSAELVDRHPQHGEKITIRAVAEGSSGTGYLTFS